MCRGVLEKKAQAGLFAGYAKGGGIFKLVEVSTQPSYRTMESIPLFCHFVIGYLCSSPAKRIKQAIQES